MKNNDILITVSGKVMSGKSKILYIIKEALKKEGLNVVYEGNFDHLTEQDFDKYASKDIDEVIERFKPHKRITIKEINLNRTLSCH